MAKHVVASVEEIPVGKHKVVEIKGRSIGVFNIDNEFFAIRNQCPHQGAPLCEGVVSGIALSKEPGKYKLVREGEIIRCPWHAWEFDIKTGQSWFDPAKTRVRSYEVNVEKGGCILSRDGLQKGPYVVERYPVLVENNYLVIEM